MKLFRNGTLWSKLERSDSELNVKKETSTALAQLESNVKAGVKPRHYQIEAVAKLLR